MSDVTSQFMKTGLKEFILPGACNILSLFIKMILGDESTTEMSRNHLSAFSTSVVFLVKIFLRRLCLARFLKPNDKKPSEEHLSKSPA